MSRYDDTFQYLLHQFTESSTKPKCNKGEVAIKQQDGTWKCVKIPTQKEEGPLAEAQQQITTVTPRLREEDGKSIWPDMFMQEFKPITLNKAPQYDANDPKLMITDHDGLNYIAYDSPVGVVIPDLDDLAFVHISSEGITSEQLRNILTPEE